MLSLACLLGALALASGHCDAASADCVGSGEVTVVERNAAVVLCAAGFEYEPDEECCVMEEVTDPRYACDVGELHGDVCAVVSRPTPVCPEGFTLDTAGCVRRSKNTMSAHCESGHMEGASCVDRVPVDVEFVCPSESQERDGQCFTTKTFQHSYFCPASWTRQGDRCVLEEIVDCTDASLPGDCGEHCYVDLECGGHDCYGSKDEIQLRLQARKRRNLSWASSAQAVCNSRPCEVHTMKPRPREESMEVISRTCVKRMETDADVFCDGPPSAVFTGENCCLQVPVDPVPMCPAEGSVHDCYTTVRKPASATCPPGFDKVCNGNSAFSCQCQKEEVVEPEPLCLAGFFEDRVCVVYQEPTAYCPERDATLVGDICVRTVREPVRLRTEIVVECEGQVCLEKLEEDVEFDSDYPTEAVKMPKTSADHESKKVGSVVPVEPTVGDVRPIAVEPTVGDVRPIAVEPTVGDVRPVAVEVSVTRKSRAKRARKAERRAIRKARRCARKQCRRQRRRRCDTCDGHFEIVDEL